MFKHILTLVVPALVLSSPAVLLAGEDSFEEYDKRPRPYLQYRVALGVTMESLFPVGDESRTKYNLGGGGGFNFEMHLLYPMSLGFNVRFSKIFLKDPDFDAVHLRNLGLTMRLHLDPRNDRQPYILFSIGGGRASPTGSNQTTQNFTTFFSAEAGAGYIMRISKRGWFRMELAFAGNTNGETVVVLDSPGVGPYIRSFGYDQGGIMFRVEAGIVSF